MRWTRAIQLGCLLANVVSGGCATGPAPLVIYEGRQETVWLQFDPKAGAGHSHPASLTQDQITTVLKGMRVKSRDVIGGFDLLSDKDSAAPFSTREILTVAPYLSRALTKASPNELATFYLVTPDPGRGPLVTSGGMFVRNGHLYVILANVRTSPSSVQYENTYESTLKDQPLLPIARFKFTVGFMPSEARLTTQAARTADGYPDYLDDSKLVVIDLWRLFGQSIAPAATPQP